MLLFSVWTRLQKKKNLMAYAYIKILCCCFLDESCIGVVCSSERNVGKSLTLQILARGQGIDRRSHPLLCSGGDQNVSGTSL